MNINDEHFAGWTPQRMYVRHALHTLLLYRIQAIENCVRKWNLETEIVWPKLVQIWFIFLFSTSSSMPALDRISTSSRVSVYQTKMQKHFLSVYKTVK